MQLILTLDNANGMAFNNRRQSRDGAVTESILTKTAGQKLWVDEYTAKLFAEGAPICVHKAPQKKAKRTDFCFVEVEPIALKEKEIDRILVYRWNRDYPSDRKAEIDFSAFRMTVAEEFVGSSHEKITLEVYEK